MAHARPSPLPPSRDEEADPFGLDWVEEDPSADALHAGLPPAPEADPVLDWEAVKRDLLDKH